MTPVPADRTDPTPTRWTVDEDRPPLTPDEFEDLFDEWQRSGGWQPDRQLVDQLFATCVAASSACATFADVVVRDADRLRQAREVATRMRRYGVGDEYAEVVTLLDLLVDGGTDG
jgi:hypothetical protein